MNFRVFWLAPVILFFGGCAVQAQSADVPQIEDISAEPEVLVSYAGQDPVKLVVSTLNTAFEGASLARTASQVTAAKGTVTIWMDAAASTLSAAEAYMRYCRAAANVIETADVPSSVKAIAVVQPDGRAIAAATAESPACFYR